MKGYTLVAAWVREGKSITVHAKSNCVACFGRGYTGQDSETSWPVTCGCIVRTVKDVPDIKEVTIKDEEMPES